MSIYTSYVENYQVAMMTLQRLCDQNQKFNSFIEEINEKKQINLRELLPLPLSHFSKYEMKISVGFFFYFYLFI